MREARAEIDEEVKDMSWKELRQWLDRQRPTDPFLATLWDRAKPPAVRKVTRRQSRPDDSHSDGERRPASRDGTAASGRAGRETGPDHRQCSGIPRPSQAGRTRRLFRLT